MDTRCNANGHYEAKEKCGDAGYKFESRNWLNEKRNCESTKRN